MTTPEPGSVGDLGEFGLVAAVTASLASGKGVEVGPGDDAAVVSAPDGRVVVTTDVLVEGRHFRRDWSSAGDVGHKAAAQSLADVAAMGARPTALVVGFACPSELPASWAVEMSEGLAQECAEVGAFVVGGDVVRSEAIVVSVTALGDLEGRGAVLRSGAQVGNVIAVIGRLGWSTAGMAVLQRGFRAPRILVDAHRRPQPPYAQGVKAAIAGATSMCDVSDGLLADLGHVSAASGVGVNLRADSFEIDEALTSAGAALAVDPMSWVLTGGEDHALVATFPPDVRRPRGWRLIGEITVGEGVRVDGVPWSGQPGYDHFA